MEIIKESFLILLTTPFYVVAIATEIVLSYRQEQPLYSVRGTLENIYLSSLNMGIDLLTRGVALAILNIFFSYRVFNFDGGRWYWIILFVGVDFMFYWLHRVDHRCRLFWAIHVTHHSSEEFNLTVGFRSSVLQPLYRFLYFIPLAVLGFRAEDIYLIYAIAQIYGILLHTQWKGNLKWLEWILVTPSLHRVHHGSNPAYIDKNMGMVFIFWDRFFGTFHEEIYPVTYGITKPLKNRGPLHLVVHEWIDIFNMVRKEQRNMRLVLKYIFGPPEWNPTDDMRKVKISVSEAVEKG